LTILQQRLEAAEAARRQEELLAISLRAEIEAASTRERRKVDLQRQAVDEALRLQKEAQDGVRERERRQWQDEIDRLRREAAEKVEAAERIHQARYNSTVSYFTKTKTHHLMYLTEPPRSTKGSRE
jgi:hypothetical protein